MDLKEILENLKNYSDQLKKLETETEEKLGNDLITVVNSSLDLKSIYGEDYPKALEIVGKFSDLENKYSEVLCEFEDWQGGFQGVLYGIANLDYRRINSELEVLEDLAGGDT